MRLIEVCFVVEPTYYRLPLQFGGFDRYASHIAAPWIIQRTLAITVMHGIVVYIQQNVLQIGGVIDLLSFKGMLEQASRAVVTLVEGLRVGIEKMGEFFRWVEGGF